ncbi:hypothetical protein RBU49_16035 [Clostridium sp. MB40-C1]|uniref:hypothetical protein n=1 Tax=Clostridium sp. MB40-C1 TaxID=3070996 RepID=UPI0027E03522|nr:hypothetical protein [Clostridium sp. MB40-C1]WMJ80293.1 hypothetical protein RBU49_16035 [Clostridium sp. MB40-C1]
MKNDLEIDVSEIAYMELKNLLITHKDEYSCIRFDYKKTCCKRPPVEIYLDTFETKENYFNNNFKNIPFIYNKELLTNISKIELIYKNSTFMIKTTPKTSNSDSCHSCSNCSSCSNMCNNHK